MTPVPAGTLEGLLTRAAEGDADGLAALYTPDAVLDLNLPMRSVRVRGREAIAGSPTLLLQAGTVRVLSSRRVQGGSTVRLESVSDDGSRQRRRHLVHWRRGHIALHVVLPERAPVRELPPLPDLPGDLADVVERVPLEPGISGTLIERWNLADGSVVFAKHLRPGGSWLQRASRDSGREAWLVETGVLERIGAFVDHGVIGAVQHRDGHVVLTRDLSRGLSPKRLSADGVRRVLSALGAMQARVEPPERGSLCSLEDRLLTFSPATAERERAETDLAPKVVGRGWKLFRELAPDDVSDAVFAALERPGELAERLRSYPTALIHGDLRPANIGFRGRRVTLIDWGLAASAPAALDVAWLAFNIGTMDPGGPGVVLGAVAGELDRASLLPSLFATLVQAGCYFGFEAVMNPDPGVRRRARAGLAWWVDRAREALAR